MDNYAPVNMSHRKRLRALCAEELPWRAQANLLLSNCYLCRVFGQLKALCGGDEGEGRVEQGLLARGDHKMRFDSIGIIVEGVVPVFAPAIAGQGNQVSEVM